MRVGGVAGLFAMLTTVAPAGCVTTSLGPATSEGPAVYIPVFVDETAGTELGISLPASMQRQLYRHAPHRLALMSESGGYVVDGTVHHLREVSAHGETLLEVCASARVHRAGGGQGDRALVDACDEAPYRAGNSPVRTAHARRRALGEVTEGLAFSLLEKILRVIADEQRPAEGSDG